MQFAIFGCLHCAIFANVLSESLNYLKAGRRRLLGSTPYCHHNWIERQNSDLGRGLVHSVFGLGCHTFCWGWCLSRALGLGCLWDGVVSSLWGCWGFVRNSRHPLGKQRHAQDKLAAHCERLVLC